MDIDLSALRKVAQAHLDNLKNFQFSYNNPLFWVFLLLSSLVLLRFWRPRKSLSFCLILAIILLATTKIENITVALIEPGEVFDPVIIRVVSIIIIIFISIYYVFIRED